MDKREKFKKYLGVGVMLAAGLFVAPIIFLAITGLVGLVAAAVIGGLVMALTPAFTEKMAQLKFQAMKVVISRAPVETLHQRAKERSDDLAEQRDILHQQAAALAEFKRKAMNFNKRYPEDSAEINEQLAGYEQLFVYRTDMFKQAKAETQNFMAVVEKAEAIYEMAVADAELGKSFNKGKDFMAIYREKTAFDAIDKANSTALANLRMALVDDDFVKKNITQTEQTRQVQYDAAGAPVLGSILDINKLKAPALSVA